MKKNWIYSLCLLCLLACTNNNSVNSFEEDGNDCCLTISTSLLSCGETPLDTITKTSQSERRFFLDDLPENSEIGLCVYRSGSFDPLTLNSEDLKQTAENILSRKSKEYWQNSTDIQLRQPVNVYAYFPFNNEDFIPGKANNPAISSDDVSPMIKIKPGSTNYLYGKAEKNGNGIMDIITPKKSNANIRFNHAMALISIRFKNAEILEKIDKAELNKITAEAFLSLENGSLTTPDSLINRCNIKLYRNDKASVGILNESDNALFQAFVIPQSLDQDIACTLFMNNISHQINLNNEIQEVWESGNGYVYTLSINKGDIIIEDVSSYKL